MARHVTMAGRIQQALMLALRQLADGRILAVLLLSLLIALALTGPFLLVFVIIAAILDWILPASLNLPWIGQVGFLGVFTHGLASKTSWVFWTYVMSPVAVAVIGALLDWIVDAVEARHYPGLPAVRHRSFAQIVGYGIRFLFLMLGVSLAALVVSFFSGVAAPVVFVLANGYLIGREYFETVALRRVSEADAKALTGRMLPLLWLLGSILALGLSVPFLNLVVPILGVAAFTHLYHRPWPAPSG